MADEPHAPRPGEVVYHGYEIPDRPGARLVIGRQPGKQRPEMWLDTADGRAVLASFHGEKQMQVTVNFLDTMIDVINRVIAHLEQQHGDEHGPSF